MLPIFFVLILHSNMIKNKSILKKKLNHKLNITTSFTIKKLVKTLTLAEIKTTIIKEELKNSYKNQKNYKIK